MRFPHLLASTALHAGALTVVAALGVAFATTRTPQVMWVGCTFAAAEGREDPVREPIEIGPDPEPDASPVTEPAAEPVAEPEPEPVREPAPFASDQPTTSAVDTRERAIPAEAWQPRVVPAAPASGGAFVPAEALASENAPPTYPPGARRRGQHGTVVIELAIDERGAVTGARVTSSSGFPLLDDAALRALSAWRFRPATRDGEPIRVTFPQAVEFRLDDALRR